jgi:hypothetical protein
MADYIGTTTESEDDVVASFFATLPRTLAPISLSTPVADQEEETHSERRQFRIRLANTPERRESANVLIDRMYAWKGYGRGSLVSENPHRITLVTYGMENQVIGTISVGMDSPEGLYADENYKQELDTLRAQGCRLCEYNALAVDSSIKSKRVLASLFHIAMLYPYGLFGYTDGVIEVAPNHAGFYRKMMGFSQIGDERICPRVNVPGVLLRGNFNEANERIARVGGLMDKETTDMSLFPYFFSKTDADGILGRLRNMA